MIRASLIDGAEYFVIGHAFDHLVYARQGVGIEVSVAIDHLRIINRQPFVSYGSGWWSPILARAMANRSVL